MPKVTVEVNVLLEMNLTEALALRDALGNKSEAESPGNNGTYRALDRALKSAPLIFVAGGAE